MAPRRLLAASFALVLLATIPQAAGLGDAWQYNVHTQLFPAGTWSFYSGPAPIVHESCPAQGLWGQRCMQIGPGTKVQFRARAYALDGGKGFDRVVIDVESAWNDARCSHSLFAYPNTYTPNTAQYARCGYVEFNHKMGPSSYEWIYTVECTSLCPAYIGDVGMYLGHTRVSDWGVSLTPDAVGTAAAQTRTPGKVSYCASITVRGSAWYPDYNLRVHWGDNSFSDTTVRTTQMVQMFGEEYFLGTTQVCHAYQPQVANYQLTIVATNQRFDDTQSWTRSVSPVPDADDARRIARSLGVPV